MTSGAHRLRTTRARRLRRACFGLGVAWLAACAPPADIGYRDTSVQITATTRFTPERFSGQWHVIEAYPTTLFPSCVGQEWLAKTAGDSLKMDVQCAGQTALTAPLDVDARGVLQLVLADFDTPDRALWVMWMDEEARIALIGTPGGEMGWILSRSPDVRADRRQAAREIMAFNGYDSTELQEVTR